MAKARLTDSVREGLNQAVAHLNTSTIRTQVDEVWNGLRAPIQLEPNSWLQFNIDKIKHNGFSIGGQRLDDTIHVVANPVIVFGPEPPAITAGLPQLDTQLASPGYHVVADIPLDDASLSQSLAGRLQGKRVAVKEDFILITDASIFGLGGNQVLLKIVFTGDAIGHLYFVGKPDMNALTQTVQISGLRGEIGLVGEIRSVSRLSTRLHGGARMGFDTAVVAASTPRSDAPAGLTLRRAGHVVEALSVLREARE